MLFERVGAPRHLGPDQVLVSVVRQFFVHMLRQYRSREAGVFFHYPQRYDT